MRDLGVSKSDITAAQLSNFVYDTPSAFNKIATFHYELVSDGISKKEKKKDIVFIGRGWVKAGFQFDQLDERNFYYDARAKVIQFYGLSPKILHTDINPWFIPERKIKGFELVDFYKRASFEEAKEVKIKCKEKLLEQAEVAKILDAAKANGIEALKNFFSLLLEEPDLKVEMIDFPYEKNYQMMIADSLISVNEALAVGKLFKKMTTETKFQSESQKLRRPGHVSGLGVN